MAYLDSILYSCYLQFNRVTNMHPNDLEEVFLFTKALVMLVSEIRTLSMHSFLTLKAVEFVEF